jgi:hypothetical protein
METKQKEITAVEGIYKLLSIVAGDFNNNEIKELEECK